jgi:hypothetical protein
MADRYSESHAGGTDSAGVEMIQIQSTPSSLDEEGRIEIDVDDQVKEQIRNYDGWMSTDGQWELKGMGRTKISSNGKKVLVYFNRLDNRMQFKAPAEFHRASVARYCILRPADIQIYDVPIWGSGISNGKKYTGEYLDQWDYLNECFEITGKFMRGDNDSEECKMIFHHQTGGFMPVEDPRIQETEDKFYFAARFGFNDEWEHYDGDFDEHKSKERAKVLRVQDSNIVKDEEEEAQQGCTAAMLKPSEGDLPLWGTTLAHEELEGLPRYWWSRLARAFGYPGYQQDWLGEWMIGKEAGTGAQLLFITLRHYLLIVLGVMIITAYNIDTNRSYKNPNISTKAGEGSNIAATTPGGLFYTEGNSTEVQNQFLVCHTLVVMWVLASMFVLERRKASVADGLDLITFEASDYALELSNLPNDCTDEDLKNHFERVEFKDLYNEVLTQIEDEESEKDDPRGEKIAEEVKKDIERITHEDAKNYKEGDSMMVKEMCVVGKDVKAYLDAIKTQSEHDIVLCQLEARLGLDEYHGQELDKNCCVKFCCPTTKALEAAKEEEKKAFDEATKQYYKMKDQQEEGKPCNGHGFVVFRWMDMARAVHRWYNPSACDILKSVMNTITCGCCECFAPTYQSMKQAPPSLRTAEGENSKSCFDGMAAMVLPFPGDHAAVTVKKAPQPRLIMWENFSADEWQRFKIKIKMRCYLLLACIISCGLQWAVEYGKQAQIEATKGNRTDTQLDFYESSYVSGVCYAASTFTLVLLTVISTLCYMLNDAQPHENTTNAAQALLEKRYVVYVLNTVVFLYLVNTNPSGGGTWFKTVGWYQAGGLGEAAFWLALSNAFVPSIQVLLGTWDWIMITYGRFSASCQRHLDNAWAPLDFDFAEAYATAQKSMAICFLFLPIVPLVVYPTIVGLVFQYIAAKYYLLRFSRRPYHSDELGAANTRLLYLIILGYIIMLPIVYCGEGVGGGLNEEEKRSTLDQESSASWVYVYVILVVFGFLFMGICTKPLVVLWHMCESALRTESTILKKGKPYPRGSVHVDMLQQRDGPLTWSYIQPPKRQIRSKVDKDKIRKVLEEEAEAAAAEEAAAEAAAEAAKGGKGASKLHEGDVERGSEANQA